MRLTFTSPPGGSAPFNEDYYETLLKRLLPWWLRQFYCVPFWGISFLFAIGMTRAVDRGVAVTLVLWVVFQLAQKGSEWVCQRKYEAYRRRLPGAGQWSVELEERHFVAESRGMRYSFPFSGLSHVWERDAYVFVDFGDWGRCRIPFSAFPTAEDRFAFIKMLDRKKDEAAQPVATDNPVAAR